MKADKYAQKEKYIITVVPHLDELQNVCTYMHECAHTCTRVHTHEHRRNESTVSFSPSP